ncbi:MAG: hypothetical protein ACJ76K_09850, partial [Solirubrobacteraceae bacterium]
MEHHRHPRPAHARLLHLDRAAELSSGPWEEPRTYWVSAVGLPTELDPPPAADPAEVIRRVHGGGAFLVLLHPALNHLPVQASG